MIKIMIFIVFINSWILFNFTEIIKNIRDFMINLKINFIY